ncbi:MAG TPA: histone deacetylase, partial [Anaeromyxobacteraceae bacterium]|nr:histone deacetylase [Anaeromyxobacteraceae bacterium]
TDSPVKRVTLTTNPACALHDPGPGHADVPGRLEALIAAVRGDAALLATVDERIAQPATEEDLLRVHDAAHVAAVREAAARAEREGAIVWLDEDTAASAGSWRAALAAAGCAIRALEAVLDGSPTGTAAAFALSRPPGHHATRARAMGFCLFNNVAVAIRRLQAQGRIRRVLVVDWDAHHANGTQEIFYEDPDVYVLSLHLHPHYPGTGHPAERGAGHGIGATRNVPLPAGTGAGAYRRAFLSALDEALSHLTPELVVVSAGFDCLAGDPEGGLLLQPSDLHRLAAELVKRVGAAAHGRLVGVLEGGYAIDRIGAGLVNLLRAFARLPPV